MLFSIIGFISLFAIVDPLPGIDEARNQKVKIDLKVIEMGLQVFYLDNGVYPTSEQGLQALVRKPQGKAPFLNYKSEGYLEALPVDPWGNEYGYKNIGGDRERHRIIWSKGSPSSGYQISMWVKSPNKKLQADAKKRG